MVERLNRPKCEAGKSRPIQIFSFKKMHLKISSAKCQPFCICFMCYAIMGCELKLIMPGESHGDCIHQSLKLADSPKHSHSLLVSPIVCWVLHGSAPLLAQQGLPSEGARSANQKPKHTHTRGASDCGPKCEASEYPLDKWNHPCGSCASLMGKI